MEVRLDACPLNPTLGGFVSLNHTQTMTALWYDGWGCGSCAIVERNASIPALPFLLTRPIDLGVDHTHMTGECVIA